MLTNPEKALVGAFSVIKNLRMELFEALINTLIVLPSLAMCRSPPGTRLWLSATTARAATGKVGVTNNPDHTVQGGIYIIVQGGRCTSWARPAPPAPPGTPAMTACVPACDHSQETFVNTIKEKYNRAINPSSLYQYVSVSLGTTQSIL